MSCPCMWHARLQPRCQGSHQLQALGQDGQNQQTTCQLLQPGYLLEGGLTRMGQGQQHPSQAPNFLPTRWYSFLCVLQGVDTYWFGFQHYLSLCQNHALDTSKLPDSSKPPTPTLQYVIRDVDHHCSNKYMLLLIKPIVDAIGRLERKNSHLGQIWKNFIGIYCEVKKVDLSYRLEGFQIFTLGAIQTCAQKFFDDDNYYITFFLCPW